MLVQPFAPTLCVPPAGVLGRRLGSTSKELVAVLLPLTTHKSHRVRVAAIGAVRDVVHQVWCIGGNAVSRVSPLQ
jgi:hypothetical protein